jgi:hypothetical protein
MRSIMPGERWAWCYVHEAGGELAANYPATKKESLAYGKSQL